MQFPVLTLGEDLKVVCIHLMKIVSNLANCYVKYGLSKFRTLIRYLLIHYQLKLKNIKFSGKKWSNLIWEHSAVYKSINKSFSS